MSLSLERNSLFDGADTTNFSRLRISMASKEHIKSWSFGEVLRPETINYRTFKPERDGLFCARIFGPVRDYECLCGKYKRIKYKGIICEKCGVEVTSSRVRRERMGHIELASPVAHIWFLKSLPSRIATLVDLPLKIIEQILYFEVYLVVEPGITSLEYLQVLSEVQYQKSIEKYGIDSFRALIGAEAIKVVLESMDLDKLYKFLKEEIEETSSEFKRKKLLKRIKVIEGLLKSNNKPEHMILEVLPVIPPGLRPLVPLDGGRFATSDLNELYRRVINRNCRLKRLSELKAPEVIIRNERRMLQQAVDALLDNTKNSRPVRNSSKRPFKSLSDMLKGKQGRFRQNLLGKRVDYSGRSVIVVGAELQLHQCGLPKKMALELFKPFIYSKLELYGISHSIKAAKKMVEEEAPEVWDILEEVIKGHPVLLNRAPTLHRLSIQAFEPILIEGKAIQLHPLVCTAFNADFDGDQMAVHVPISFEAQIECKVLMMSVNNILSPANGKPIIMPSQDMVLGLYYLTMIVDRCKGEGRYFSEVYEIEHALFEEVVDLHTRIKYRLIDPETEKQYTVDTTPGRVLLYDVLPKGNGVNYSHVNCVMTKKEISSLLDMVYRCHGQNKSIEFVDNIMRLGFKYSTKSGISIGKDDMLVPKSKKHHIESTMHQVKEFDQQYSDGIITMGEKYNKVVDAWSLCTDKVASDMMEAISQSDFASDHEDYKPINSHHSVNSVYIMSHSGARGSESQIKQLSGMRGLITKPSGEIIETPITSNFKEGLTVLEYFNSAHGARKGLADTALKTANSGYLTRRLVDVAQNCVILEDDCGATEGLNLGYEYSEGSIFATLEEKILGRIVLEDVIALDGGSVILKKDELIDEDAVKRVINSGIDNINVRSVLMCKAEQGFCAKCYGRDLSTGKLVNKGEAVGVIAAQSIGEPGTQLTMRTFHIGGAAVGATGQSSLQSSVDGKVVYEDLNYVVNEEGVKIVVSRSAHINIVDNLGNEKSSYKINYGSRVFVDDQGKISKGDQIAEWDLYNILLINEVEGRVKFNDLHVNVSYKDEYDEETGLSSQIVTDWKSNETSGSLAPAFLITDSETGEVLKHENDTDYKYFLSIDSILNVQDGQIVKPGDILAKIPKKSARVNDITGGLPRVAELFEARKQKDNAIICEADGIIKYGKDYKSKRRVILIRDDNPLEHIEYLLPKGKHISVREGDHVKKGDFIIEGNPSPHDILSIMGVTALTKYMVPEIQKVYRLQGVSISDVHLEVILSQMLTKVTILDPGDTDFVEGDKLTKKRVEAENQKMIDAKSKPAKYNLLLRGITKSSLETDSFISAASFQETTKILTDAALSGRADPLSGLKENIIVGRLIPAGTGYFTQQYMNKAQTMLDQENDMLEGENRESLSDDISGLFKSDAEIEVNDLDSDNKKYEMFSDQE